MKKRGHISYMALAIALAALVLSWSVDAGRVQALDASGPIYYKNLKEKGRVTPAEIGAAAKSIAERKAAAKAAAEPELGVMAVPPAPVSPMLVPGAAPRYFSHPNYANSQLPTVDPVTGAVTGGIKKFVDTLPGLTPAGANNLGNYIPVAVPDTTTYPGSDYYEIGLVQYRQKFHTDIPATLLRGYVQISTGVVPGGQVPLTNAMLDGTSVPIPGFAGVDAPHYLGPIINATKGIPVRIKFYNLLPTGEAGDLFIPTDTSLMGAGTGPMMMNAVVDPLNPPCGVTPKPDTCYTENRATIHMHGGVTAWISDGTPHQWITPAGENTTLPQGVSVSPVPDMNDPGDPHDGFMTFYYANHQSARMLFYHDHAWGITRLNVYAGHASAYLLTDDVEKELIAAGTIPGAADTIPLVIQDKTFVPSLAQLEQQDETWDTAKWGSTGNLWLPHVYVPAQNPEDITGFNAYGRWMYGPYFWPPTSNIEYGPVPNPYFDPACDADITGWCEPSIMPGTPYNSMGMEAFHDTPIVNGAAYPTVTLEPKAYRFRILSVANDRSFNLSWYVADPSGTEVALNAAEVALSKIEPFVYFPTPDEAISPKGPDWIQIGTEGGFLPAPVVLPAQPTTWVTDPTLFRAGQVDKHSLLLAPAERADVIVDFSAFAGQTLILYNDAPAAFPARDPRYDYFTDSADLTDVGGVPVIQPGYGPNTRTVMQVKIAGTPAPAFNLTALETAFKSTTLGGGGVFERGQKPIVVGQDAYDSAYGTNFRLTPPRNGMVSISDFNFTFDTLSGTTLTMPLYPKQIQDEMGEAFDPLYGRMSGFLGVETPFAQAGLQNMVLMPFDFPPTEIIAVLPATMEATPISTLDDGTQIWRITHNGVDTHPIHFHLYDVQLINRVAWDNDRRFPEPNELGWKDTVRVSPLEDTIVALRPIIPYVPFDVPNSIRLLNPSMPEGEYIANTTAALAAGEPVMAFDPNGEPVDIINHYVNFGWEYVWHCHILSHEEMDMMRNQAVGVAPKDPTGLSATLVGSGTAAVVNLSWSDNSKNETAFSIQRATDPAGPWTPIAQVPSVQTGPTLGVITYTDPLGTTVPHYYRVQAVNVVGDTWDYTDPNLNNGAGFPTLTMVSAFSNVATWAVNLPAAPSNYTIEVRLTTDGRAYFQGRWIDNSNNETGFTIQSATDAAFTQGVTTYTLGANRTDSAQIRTPSTIVLYYRIRSFNANGTSAWANATPFPASLPVQPPAVPAAPSNYTIEVRLTTDGRAYFQGRWIDNSNNETGFTIQSATDAAFTQGVTTYTLGVNRTDSAQIRTPSTIVLYYRIRSFNANGASAWANATPFPASLP